MFGRILQGIFLFIFQFPFFSFGQYCLPTYVNPCGSGDHIRNFSINTLYNLESGCASNNYTNYAKSAFTTNLEEGSSYEVMVSSPGYLEMRLYFDFNKDFDFNDAGEFFLLGNAHEDTAIYSTITIPAGISGDVRMRVRGAINETITANDACDLKDWGETEDYTVTIVPPYAMNYFRNEVVKDTSYIVPGSTNQKMIRFTIENAGSLSPLNATSFSFATAGTTDPANISSARLFYTGSSRTFSTSSPFGSLVNTPNGTFTFSGNQQLVQGKNFFWLVYDLRTDAPLYQRVDASISSFEVGGLSYSAAAPTFEGSKEILKFIEMQNGSATVGIIDFVDDGGPYRNYSTSNYKLTLFPESPGSILSVQFTQFNLCAINEVGCDQMVVIDGNSASTDTLEIDYDNPGTVTSTAVDGSLTFVFNNTTGLDPRGMEETTFVGWRARITNVPNVALSTATISGNSTILPGQSGEIHFAFTGVAPYFLIYSNGTIRDTLKNINASSYTVTTSVPGTYTILKFTDGLSRSGIESGSALIVRTEPDELKAPEGFSPNGDSFNDVFYVQGIKAPLQISLYVYNREGNIIYSSENYKNNWDGKKSNGEALPDGTYYYVITTNDQSKTLKSYVELRR